MSQRYIQKTTFKVSDFISWQKKGNLLLSPDFQRRSVWKKGAKSFLIDTIVKGMPIPIIFVRDRRINTEDFEPKREIVDGQQRLRTVLSFICPEFLDDYDESRDKFAVTKNHNKDIAGKPFNALDEDIKEAILDYEFSVHVIPPRMDDREVIQIFRRMNSTNYSLNPQELRNAEFYGEFKTSAYDLAAEYLHVWRRWKTFTADDISRMKEVEFVSEFLIYISEKQIRAKSSARINRAYKEWDETFPNRLEIEKRFRNAVDLINSTFIPDTRHFEFTKKTLLYTFFSFIYDSLFGGISLESEAKEIRNLSTEFVASVKLASERIQNRTAPNDVLEATDRRTTHVGERRKLFGYLKNITKNA